MANPVAVLFAAQDAEDQGWCTRLRQMLQPLVGRCTLWDRSELPVGAQVDAVLDQKLAEADLILVLVSPRLLADAQWLRVAPSLAQDTLWPLHLAPCLVRHDALLAQLRFANEQPITTAANGDAALCGVAERFAAHLGEITSSQTGAATLVEPPQLFVGRTHQLDELSAGLGGEAAVQVVFQLQGQGGIGKSTLARQALWLFRKRFDAVVELPAEGHNPQSFARALAQRLGQQPGEPPDERAAHQTISQLLAERRVLLLIDNVTRPEDLKYILPQESRSRVILTTREQKLGDYLRAVRPDLRVNGINLALFDEAETLALFREALGALWDPADAPGYLRIGARLGWLPVALHLAANLRIFPPELSLAELEQALADRLRVDTADDLGGELRKVSAVFDLGQAGLAVEQRALLDWLAVCAEGPVPLSLLDAMAQQELRRTADELVRRGWCTREVEPDERYYQLHVLVRDVIRSALTNPQKQARFLELIHDTFTKNVLSFLIKDRWVPQLEEALALWRAQQAAAQKDLLFRTFYEFCARRGHGRWFVILADQVIALFPENRWICQAAYGQKALILSDWGKLEEAMALHQKEEKICAELGDQTGLSQSYGNQALILTAWGKLEEAMALHQKEEKLKEELGDQAGLSGSYGNQALILSAWGKLEEAMALHQKEEKLCAELGDQTGLSQSYGNQALILSAWGKLEEAMALHQKEEKLCEELGDQAGLAICWWNMGCLFKEQGQPAKTRRHWEKAIQKKKKIGIPALKNEQALAALDDADG